MAHWPTIAATTALAAFVVAGAVLHVGDAPAVVAAAAPGTASGADRWDGAARHADSTVAAASQRLAHAAVPAPGFHASGTQAHAAGAHAGDMAAQTATQTAGQPGNLYDRTLASSAGEVATRLPHGAATSGLRPPVPVTVAPLPPLPPKVPVTPGMTGTGGEQALPVPASPALPQQATAGATARMMVAMPLSIPELGPLDPARIGGAARELAETVHVLATQASHRALAAEQAAAGARKQPDLCPREAGPRPASLVDDLCDKMVLQPRF